MIQTDEYDFECEYFIPENSNPPPAAPTLTAPTSGLPVFNGVLTTLSATTSDSPTRIDWILDPSGAATVIGTDSTAPYSQSWTPTGVSTGSHVVIARAVGPGGTTNSAPITIIVGEAIHTRFTTPTVQRSWQADSGLSLGGTPLASGTTPPALTLTGSVAGNAPALRIEVQSSTTFRYGITNTGITSTTWLEQNVTIPHGGTYAAIGAITGLVFNFPAGTYTNDNVYQGTCSAWVDLKNGFSASQAVASKQPLILVNAGGVNFLRFDGVDDFLLESVLDLAAPGTTPVFIYTCYTRTNWVVNGQPYSVGGLSLLCITSNPRMISQDGAFGQTINTGQANGQFCRAFATWQNTTADTLQLGSQQHTGSNTGNTNPSAGATIGAALAGANPLQCDIRSHTICTGIPGGFSPGVSLGSEISAADTLVQSLYPGITV